jgi:protein-arginine kinase activator protein McsA
MKGSMAACKHQQLVLVRDTDARVRCRHCHLTIKAAELVSGYCPECFETSRTRRYDFEDLGPVDPGRVRYRCEECGGMIEA